MKREPWKPLAYRVLPDITPEQARAITMVAGFNMGILEAEMSDDGIELMSIKENPSVSHAFWNEMLRKGHYLPWNTHHWLAEGFYEKEAARLAAELSRGLSG